MKYAKGDFQLNATSCVFSLSFPVFVCCVVCLISFGLHLLFALFLFLHLPAGKKLFKNVDIFLYRSRFRPFLFRIFSARFVYTLLLFFVYKVH